MTEEEIEEQAEEYVLNVPDTVGAKHSVYSEEKLKQAFQDGAKWMQEKMEAELKMKLLTLVNKEQIIKTTVSN